MQIRPVIDQETGDRDFPMPYCLIKWSFLLVIENVSTCATLDQELGNLEVAVGGCEM
jgi:hypothetical protein